MYIWTSLRQHISWLASGAKNEMYTSQQKKPIFDFRGIYLNSGITHHQLIGIELYSDQF